VAKAMFKLKKERCGNASEFMPQFVWSPPAVKHKFHCKQAKKFKLAGTGKWETAVEMGERSEENKTVPARTQMKLAFNFQ